MSLPPTSKNAVVSPERSVGSVDASEHAPVHWVSRTAFPLIVAALLVSEAALGYTVYRGWTWLAVLLVVPVSHFMHGALIGFHEASHGMLRRSRLLNEIDGLVAGALSFMSFTLYRVAHQTHHSHLATQRDEELWPFVVVTSPRWQRRLVAFIELNFGLLFTPYLFLRIFFRKDSFIKNRKVRRRIWTELIAVAVFWMLVISAVAHWHLWAYFIWIYLVPAVIAGNLQSWRKYIEHVGLSGHTARSATRSIVADTWSGRLLSLTLLHEPFHGVHHIRMSLPHAEMPRHAALLNPAEEGDVPPFPNYRSAIMDLIRNLSDPRSGSHWPDAQSQTRS